MKEFQHTEWKESWRDEHLRWVCGFANAEGGVLVIGRNDQGQTVGIPDARKLLEDLANKIRDLLCIVVEVNVREERDKDYLEVVTPPYSSPISYRALYYQRRGSTVQELKRAALLLFYGDPERFVTGAFVKIGYFRSEADLAYHDEVHGDLFAQVAGAIDVLYTKYLKAAISYQGIQRIERFPVPDAALREAVLNALIHRDYAVAAPVQIRVYEDRLKIWNPVVLPEDWSLKDLLRDHASLPYNPNVANAFFRAGEIEAWGRGIQRIFQACRDAGTPRPHLRLDGHDLWLEFAFSSEYLDAVDGRPRRKPDQGEGFGEKWGEKWGEKAAATRIRIAQAMHRDPHITIVGLAAELGVASTSGVEKHLKAMRDAGCIRRVGPAKGGHWDVIL